MFGEVFLTLFTNETNIIEMTQPYFIWVLIMPICGFAAFLWDGIYVGATASKEMRNSMLVATFAFFAIYYASNYFISNAAISDMIYWQNNSLWIAFLGYLLLRGVMQWIYSAKAVKVK